MRSFFPPNHHFRELDSVRGLAALTVMVGHYLNLFLVQGGPYKSIGDTVQVLKNTPLFALFAGHESVMLFFVLSGFVLSLQFLKGRPVNYPGYAIKRVFRIYVPYLVALVIALLGNAFLYSGRISELSQWFNYPWSTGITAKALAEHLFFLGSFRSDRFDPVLWSLVHELRISFLFPVIAAVVMRLRWSMNLLLAVTLSFTGMTATLAIIKLFRSEADYFLTVHYIGMFIMGFLLARHINEIYGWYTKRAALERIGLGVLGFLLYVYGHTLPGRLGYYHDLPIAAGAVLMVITAVCSRRTSAFLKLPIVKFFGDISYSLYLYHSIMLLAFVHVLFGTMPIGVILVLAAAASVLVSWLSYKYVEMPAIRVGRDVAARVEGKPLTAKPKAAVSGA